MDNLIDDAIELLCEIESSSEKRQWCRSYCVYHPQPQYAHLEDRIFSFTERCYGAGLVMPGCYELAVSLGMTDGELESPDTRSMATLEILCCISWHFRRDHFSEGSLIHTSIADGIMLSLFLRLRELHPEASSITTIQSLYACNCSTVPREKGIYRVLKPENFHVRFCEFAANASAPLYEIETLQSKYERCRNQQVLYIGKAGGKNGLQQRLRQYMKYGWNQSKNHKGGRAIWQIENYGTLLIEYYSCKNCEQKEHSLLREYWTGNHQTYPLANWRG